MTNGERAGLESRDELFNERRAEIEKAGATFKKIVREIAIIAFSDVQDYITVDQNGKVQAIALSQIRKGKSRAIKKIRETSKMGERKDGEIILKDTKCEFELYDKLDALKYLCKLRGDEPASTNKHEITGGPMLMRSVGNLTDDELLSIARGSGK